MDDKKIISTLWDNGHFWNPAFPDTLNVKLTDLPTLTRTDKVVTQAAESFQRLDMNFDVFVMKHHERESRFDGDIGPATEDLLGLKRCPLPDHPPPPGVKFLYDDPDIQKAVESQQNFATGSGSWLAGGCDPQHKNPNEHSIRVEINTTGAPSTVLGYLDRALAECVIAYAEVGLRVRYIKTTSTSTNCEIQKRFERLSGNVIGWNYFPHPNTCRMITGRLSSTYAPSNWLTWANLEGHETGHGVGLNHGNGHIMNPSILTVNPMRWPGSYSYAALKRFFGGVPIAPVPGPGPIPGPTPVPALTYIDGTLVVIHEGKSLGEFIIVRKASI